LKKPVVIPNEAQRNEESQRAKQILREQNVIPNESRKAGGMRNLIGLNRF
jgi:hypothetical protein